MDKNIKEAVGAEKPTVSEMLKQTMICFKPDEQLAFEAALWWEEIEAKERSTVQDMEEYYGTLQSNQKGVSHG